MNLQAITSEYNKLEPVKKLSVLKEFFLVKAKELSTLEIDKNGLFELFEILLLICKHYNFYPKLNSERYSTLNLENSISKFQSEIAKDEKLLSHFTLYNLLCLTAHIADLMDIKFLKSPTIS